MIPTDMLFLDSSLSKHHCFIDKANLNGETTLEVLNSIELLHKYFKIEENIQHLNCTLAYEPPNDLFDSFRGILKLQQQGKEGEQAEQVYLNIDGKTLLMRETN